MISLVRAQLPEQARDRLTERTKQIEQVESARQSEVAHRLWKNTTVRRRIHPALRETLATMAPGLERCMFCGDSQGTAIDHFEPITESPIRTFDWLNHLLSCTACNSHYKRDQFPRADDGSPMLIDPTTENPAEHIHLILAAGEYRGLTERGTATIAVLSLNRPILVQGRQNAYEVAILLLHSWHEATLAGDTATADKRRRVLWEQPNADVVAAMFRQALAPGAGDIFADQPQTLELLRDADVRAGILDAGGGHD
jgi:hypothetical protein